jgi:hypothetical protein
MKRVILIIVLGLLALPSTAQYHFTELGDKLIFNGDKEIDLDDVDIFANVMIWTLQQAESGKDNLVLCDWSSFKETALFRLTSPSSRRAYSFEMTVRVSDEQLVWDVRDIKEYPLASVKVGIPLEKFYPAKKPAQREVLDEADLLITELLNDFVSFVNSYEAVFRTDVVKAGRLEKGMSQDECLLIQGKPVRITDNGKKTTWLYADDSYLIFEEGRLKVIMN